MVKHKRIILIVSAIVFIALIFFIKTKSQYKSQASQQGGLQVGNLTVNDLLSKDSNGNGIPDWEENLQATDPNNKNSSDNALVNGQEIAKTNPPDGNSAGSGTAQDQNLTQTDKFSRELFSTVAALNQTGEVDQNTVDKLTTSLSDRMKNPTPRKVFVLADIKIVNDNSAQAYQNYSDTLNTLYQKNSPQGSATNILQEFIGDGQTVNADALAKLDPIIKQTKTFIDGMANIKTPSNISQMHLDVINGLERLNENLSDLQLFNNDVIVAMGAMTKYEDNTKLLQASIDKLTHAISGQLSN